MSGHLSSVGVSNCNNYSTTSPQSFAIPSTKQPVSSNLLTYSVSVRPGSGDARDDRRIDEVIVVHEDGRINETLNNKPKLASQFADVVVNERGKSHLANSASRYRSSSLYNGGTIYTNPNSINSNNLQFPIEPESQNASTLHQRRNTSCSINMVNGGTHRPNRNCILNDQKFIKQSNQVENDNQLTSDQPTDPNESSAGLLNSVWNYLSNIPKKRSPSRSRNAFYNKLCNSLNTTPVHRLVNNKRSANDKSDLIPNQSDNRPANDQFDKENVLNGLPDQMMSIKQCNCKCNCSNERTTKIQAAVLNIDDCSPSEIPAKIHEMDSFPFQPHPANKKLDKIDTEDWLRIGKEMVEYIAYYLETLDKRRVTPDVEPGYLKQLLPKEAPKKAQEWRTIMTDFEKCILPGRWY